MAAISGLLSLRAGPGTDEWVSEYQETILVRNAKGINAGGATLFGLMARLKSEPAQTTEFNWFERNPVTRVVYSDGAETAAATTNFGFTLTSAGTENVTGLLPVGTILVNDRTREAVRITVSSDGAYTVARGVGATLAVPVSDNDTWIIVTLGKDEGATAVGAVYETADVLTNYIQTFNQSVQLTNAFKGSKLRTDIEGPLRERRVQALERISRDIELAYFFGEKARETGTNGYIYYTGGLKQAVDFASTSSGNLPDVGGDGLSYNYGTTSNILNGLGNTGVTLTVFNNWLSSFMTVGSENKLFLCGPQTYAALSNYANSGTNGFRITSAENVFGMNITTIQTPFGQLDLAMHPLFKEITPLNDWGFVVDLALLVQKTMEPLFLEPNIQTPGQDAYVEQFRAKLGLKLKFAQAFGYCYDLSYIKA